MPNPLAFQATMNSTFDYFNARNYLKKHMQLGTRVNCKMADSGSTHTDSQTDSNYLYSPKVASEVAHKVELSEEPEQSRTGRKRQ